MATKDDGRLIGWLNEDEFEKRLAAAQGEPLPPDTSAPEYQSLFPGSTDAADTFSAIPEEILDQLSPEEVLFLLGFASGSYQKMIVTNQDEKKARLMTKMTGNNRERFKALVRQFDGVSVDIKSESTAYMPSLYTPLFDNPPAHMTAGMFANKDSFNILAFGLLSAQSNPELTISKHRGVLVDIKGGLQYHHTWVAGNIDRHPKGYRLYLPGAERVLNTLAQTQSVQSLHLDPILTSRR